MANNSFNHTGSNNKPQPVKRAEISEPDGGVRLFTDTGALRPYPRIVMVLGFLVTSYAFDTPIAVRLRSFPQHLPDR